MGAQPKLIEVSSIDVRRAAGGLQLAIGGRGYKPFMLRIPYARAADLIAALARDQQWVQGSALSDMRISFYSPHAPNSRSGMFGSAEEIDGVATILQWFTADMKDWRELGRQMREVTKLPHMPDGEWIVEDFMQCQNCWRPVFDSDPSVMVPGYTPGPDGAMPGIGVAMICTNCAAALPE